MTDMHLRLIQAAIDKHPGEKLTLPDTVSSLSACFTEDHGRLRFWYNRASHSTAVITEESITETPRHTQVAYVV